MQILELKNGVDSFDIAFQDDAKGVTIKQYVDYTTANFEYFKSKGIDFEGMSADSIDNSVFELLTDMQANDPNEYYNNYIKRLVAAYLSCAIEKLDQFANGKTLEILKSNIDKVIGEVCELGKYTEGVQEIEYKNEMYYLPKVFSDAPDVDLLREFTTQEVIEIKEVQYRTRMILQKGIGMPFFDADTNQEVIKNQPLSVEQKALFKVYQYRQLLAIMLKKKGEQLPDEDLLVDEFLNKRIETTFTECFPAYLALQMDVFFLAFQNMCQITLPLNGFFILGNLMHQAANMKLRLTKRQNRKLKKSSMQ